MAPLHFSVYEEPSIEDRLAHLRTQASMLLSNNLDAILSYQESRDSGDRELAIGHHESPHSYERSVDAWMNRFTSKSIRSITYEIS